MKDSFENNIKGKLEEIALPEFQDRHWDKMKLRMKKEEKKSPKGIFVPFWALGGLLLAPLLLLVFLMNYHNSTNREISKLKTDFNQIKENSNLQNNEQNKTIKSITTIYDTIRKVTIIEDFQYNKTSSQTKPRSIYFNPYSIKEDLFTDKSNTSLFSNINYPINSYNFNFTNSLYNSKEHSTGRQEKDKEKLNNGFKNNRVIEGELHALQLEKGIVLNEDRNILGLNSINFKNTKKKKFKDYMAPLLPTGFGLSVKGGLGVFPINESDSKIYTTGIQANIAYNKNLSLIVGLDYLRHTSEVEFEYVENQLDFPDAPFIENPTDEIQNISGEFTYLQVPFGVQYLFLSKKKFHPILEGGMVSYKSLKSNLTYELTNSSDEEYYITQNNILNKKFKVDDAWMGLGIQYDFNKNLGVKLMGKTQFALNKRQYSFERHRYIFTDLSFTYKF